MSLRLYVVGTDTDVGKTAVVIALLRAARARSLVALPFKPAATGPRPGDDPSRLLAALDRADLDCAAINPLRFEPALAPGVAADRARFVAAAAPAVDPEPLSRAAAALSDLETRLNPDLTIIEGAGGLHVPMPGGSWQLDWVRTLAPTTLVVARAGLGTINHTLLTIDALRQAGSDPIGFVMCSSSREPDASRADNAAIVSHARGLPHLGTLGYVSDPDRAAPDWLAAELFDLVRARA